MQITQSLKEILLAQFPHHLHQANQPCDFGQGYGKYSNFWVAIQVQPSALWKLLTKY